MRQKQGRNCAGSISCGPAPTVMGGDTTCPSRVVGGQVGSFTLSKSSVQSSVKQPLTLAPTDDVEPQNMQTPKKKPPGIKPATLLLVIPQWQPLQLSVAQNTVKGSAFFSPPPHSRIHFLPTLLCAQSDINLDFCPRLRMPFTSSRLSSGFCFCCQLTAAALSQER